MPYRQQVAYDLDGDQPIMQAVAPINPANASEDVEVIPGTVTPPYLGTPTIEIRNPSGTVVVAETSADIVWSATWRRLIYMAEFDAALFPIGRRYLAIWRFHFETDDLEQRIPTYFDVTQYPLRSPTSRVDLIAFVPEIGTHAGTDTPEEQEMLLAKAWEWVVGDLDDRTDGAPDAIVSGNDLAEAHLWRTAAAWATTVGLKDRAPAYMEGYAAALTEALAGASRDATGEGVGEAPESVLNPCRCIA